MLAGGKVVNQQGQPENKKNRFSLNFLRASLLSPKDSTAAKGESIFRQSAPEAFQASVKQPETDRGAATRVDSNTSAAQSYSPLGQGAAAFTPPSPGMPAMEKQLKPLRLSIANSTMDAWTDDANTDSGGDTPARSPLRALSSNSPTRRSLSSFSKSADLQASLNQGLPLLSRTLPVSSRSDAQSRAFSFKPSSESQALNLSRQPQHQHSPLPPNALVAYSSDDTDEDDCRSGVDATESKHLCHHSTFAEENLGVCCHLCHTALGIDV